MKIACIKNFRITLSLIIFTSAFFLNAVQSDALSRSLPGDTLFASYEQGSFTDGFGVQHKFAGYRGTRPVVNEQTENVQDIFLTASRNLEQTPSSGVYRLSLQCRLSDVLEWKEWCAGGAVLEELTPDSGAFAQYKAQWQQKEEDRLRSIAIEKWSVAATIMVVVTFPLFWSWTLIKIWPRLRKRLLVPLMTAIPLQMILIISVKMSDFIPFPFPPSWWERVLETTFFSSSIILILFFLPRLHP